ncbi:MAG: hypothetical protein WD187_00740 [Candidatus Woykebacteria bacterium]
MDNLPSAPEGTEPQIEEDHTSAETPVEREPSKPSPDDYEKEMLKNINSAFEQDGAGTEAHREEARQEGVEKAKELLRPEEALDPTQPVPGRPIQSQADRSEGEVNEVRAGEAAVPEISVREVQPLPPRPIEKQPPVLAEEVMERPPSPSVDEMPVGPPSPTEPQQVEISQDVPSQIQERPLPVVEPAPSRSDPSPGRVPAAKRPDLGLGDSAPTMYKERQELRAAAGQK